MSAVPPSPGSRRPRLLFLLETAAAFLAYGLATAWFLRPIWRLGGTHLAPGLGDPLFNLYLLAWVGRQVRLGLPDVWGANFFHPAPDALALSDHMLGPGAQAAAIQAATGGGVVAAYNVLLFLSFALAGTTTFAVLRAGGLGRSASFLGGAVFAFSPYRWEQAFHLQVLLAQWIPPLLWSFHRLLERPRAGMAAAFLVFYLLHVTGGTYLAYLVHLPLLVLLGDRLLRREGRQRLLSRHALRVLVPAAAACALLLAAVFVPYLEASGRHGLRHVAENYQQFGATLVAQATPAAENWYFPSLRPLLKPLAPGYPAAGWRVEKALFPGFLATLLAAAGVVSLWRRHRRRPAAGLSPAHRWTLRAVAAAAVAAFLAADLLTLGWWPPPWRQAMGGLDGAYSLLGAVFFALLAGRFALGRWWNGSLPLALPTAAPWERGLLYAALACWLLAFPVVFEPLSEVVPGLSGMRTPTRTWPFVSFAIAWFAGRGLDGLLRRVGSRTLRALAGGVAALWIFVESTPRPFAWHRVPVAPPVYSWIAANSDVHALLVLPLRRNEREIPAMWYSTAHWRPIVNGFSAFTPRAYQELRAICCWPMPDERALETLRRMGVTHVVVHPVWERRWQHRELAAWTEKVAAGEVPGVRLVYRDERGDHVYAITSRGADDETARPAGRPETPPIAGGPAAAPG